MSIRQKQHSFSIPVMGIGFTLDTPLKVSKFGIDSVISLVDDLLMENMRKVYCNKFKIAYEEISEQIEDFRAKRITSYLNLINDLAKKKFDEFKNITLGKSNDIKEFFSILNINSESEIENLSMGSIDVNIMTKLDKANYKDGEKLPAEFNDAHAALRGYANSNLTSSIVFSAGMNPMLYSYITHFDDFYPDKNGDIKKKIILKVSDYRSALIQGRILAKKGLWISEYRIESGLNCGGHAFATAGLLLGPILNEFTTKRKELKDDIHKTLVKALTKLERVVPKDDLDIKVTVQGGVGSSEEHDFLLDHYKMDSVGWGSPFLLVPEATALDRNTLDLLASSSEENFYLSGISPLGVPFNNLMGNTKDVAKQKRIDDDNPGSICTKRYLISNTEFTENSICTASKQYQHLKIEELKKQNLSKELYTESYNKIVEKSCLCVGLGTASHIVNNLSTESMGSGVSVCPGPNMAYFNKIMSMKDMTGFIYGKVKNLTSSNRPNMFVKELGIYVDYIEDKIDEVKTSITSKQEKFFLSFIDNIKSGISYYDGLFSEAKNYFSDTKIIISKELGKGQKALDRLILKVEGITKEVK